MLLQTWMHKHLSESPLEVLLALCPEVELLDSMVILCLIFLRKRRTVFRGGWAIHIESFDARCRGRWAGAVLFSSAGRWSNNCLSIPVGLGERGTRDEGQEGA